MLRAAYKIIHVISNLVAEYRCLYWCRLLLSSLAIMASANIYASTVGTSVAITVGGNPGLDPVAVGDGVEHDLALNGNLKTFDVDPVNSTITLNTTFDNAWSVSQFEAVFSGGSLDKITSITLTGGTAANAASYSASASNKTITFNVPEGDNTNGTVIFTFTSTTLGPPDTTPPTVTSVTSSTPDGTYKIGDEIRVQVNFSENVIVDGGTPLLTLETGIIDRLSIYTSGSGSSTLTFTYTVQVGDISSRLDYVGITSLGVGSGTIRDAAGNNATLTLPSPGAANSLGNNKALVIDGVVPTVTSVNSTTADGTYKIGDVISIQINFSEAVMVNTAGGIPQLTLETGLTDRAVNYASGSGTSSLTFHYTIQAGDNSADLDYVSTSSLALNGGTIRDAAGNNATRTLPSPGAANSLAANRALVVDGVVPSVISTFPAGGALSTDTSISFTVNFSESVNNISIDDFELGTTGNAEGTIASVSASSGSSVTVTVNGIIGNGTIKLNLKASTNIQDEAGNSSPPAYTSGTMHTVNIPTAPGAPTIGAAVAGDGQVFVTFTAPVSNGGSAITTYTARANPGGAFGTCAGPAACTATVTGLTNGTAYTFTVTATNAVGTSTASGASNAVTPKANQTISFANPIAQNFGNSPTLSATATSNLTVTFSSSTTGVCTITPSGTLTFVTAGTCTIDAHQGGNAFTNAAPTVSRTFMVNAVPPGLPVSVSATAGDTQADVTFLPPATNGGAMITGYTVTANPGGATGTGAGSPITVVGLTNGVSYTFTVTATNSAGTGSSSAASNAIIPASPQVITFNNPGPQNFGTTPTLTASSTSGLTIGFTSSTTSVCTITSGGVLTFVAAGTCTINANQAGDSSYLPASQVSHSFTVNPVIPGAPINVIATAGDEQATVVFAAPVNTGGVTITSYTVTANPGGATGSGSGSPITLQGLTNGTDYTFTVRATNSAGTGGVSAASNTITPAAPQTITFANPGAQSFGTSPTFNATSTSQLPVTFTSATASVCTITASGAVTFLSAGTCTINANQAGNSSYLPAAAVSQSFTVNAVLPGVPAIGTATAGDAQATVMFTAPASTGGTTITSYTITANPGGITRTAASSPYTFTGLTNGTAYTFTVSATNSAGSSAASAASNSVTPKAPNQAPVISGTPATSVNQDTAYSFIPTATDVDGDTLTFSITNIPSWASFDTATGALTGTPVKADVGTTNGIVITVSDDEFSASLPAFNLEVVNVNDIPVITGMPASLTVTRDTASDINLSTLVITDNDNDPVTLTLTVSAGILTASSGNNVTITNSGTAVLTLHGTTTDLGTYLSTVGHVQYISDTGVSGVGIATLTITPDDGTDTGVDVSALINIWIAPFDENFATKPQNLGTDTDLGAGVITFEMILGGEVFIFTTDQQGMAWIADSGAGASVLLTSAVTEWVIKRKDGLPFRIDELVFTNYHSQSISFMAQLSKNGVPGSTQNITLTHSMQSDDVLFNGEEADEVRLTSSDMYLLALSRIKGDAGEHKPNTAPTATNLNQNLSFTAGRGEIVVLDDIVVTDNDIGDTITATLSLSHVSAGLLTTGTFGSVASVFDSVSGVWTVSGDVADVNAALAAVTYEPAADWEQDFTITTRIRDAADTGPVDGAINVAVKQNAIPVNTSIPQISGSATIGGLITATTGIWEDADGDALSYSYQWFRANDAVGSNAIAINGATSASYTLTAGDIRRFLRVVVTADDGYGSADQQAASAWVAVNNVAPVISGVPATSVNQDAPYSFIPTATDPDGDTLIFSIINKPSWAAFDAATGSLTGVPVKANVGVTTGIVITVTDGEYSASLPAFNLEVINVNDAPVISGTPATSVKRGEAYNFTPVATDADGDTLTFSIANKPVWASFNASTGQLSGTPAREHVGSTTGIVISVSDGTLSASLPAFALTVTAVNDAPEISGTPATSVKRGEAYNFTPVATDADGDTLTFSIANKPVWASFNASTGQLSGTPAREHVGSTSGIVISVSDGTLSASLPAFALTVTAVNDAPEISGTPATSVKRGEAYNFTPVATDADGDTLTFSIANKPVWASFNASTGQLSGTPAREHVGSTSGIVISVSDGTLSASLPAFALTVTAVNDAPVISGTPATSVNQDTAYSFIPTATDPDGDALTFSITNKPSWASFDTATGALTGTPVKADVGTTNGIVITVSDDEFSASLPAFNLEVVNVNEAPVAVDDVFDLPFSISGVYELDVLANDSDPDGDVLTITNTSTSIGTVVVADNKLRFTAPENFSGTARLAYRISDGEFGAQAKVLLTINGTNPLAPVISGTDDIRVNASGLFTKVDLGLVTARDVNGNRIAVTLVNGEPVFKPGAHEALWRATDSNGVSSSVTQVVEVVPQASAGLSRQVANQSQVTVEFNLNGEAPVYPVRLPYTVTGSAGMAEHDLSDGHIEITAGTRGSLTFNVFANLNTVSEKTIVITLDESLNLARNANTTITVTEVNLAPEVMLTAEQQDSARLLIARDAGEVRVVSVVSDPNGDNVSLSWQVEPVLTNVSSDVSVFAFDPTSVSSGVYQITLVATDDAALPLSGSASVLLVVRDSLPLLGNEDSNGNLIPDSVEGFGDSNGNGIPDYLDPGFDCNVMVEQLVQSNRFLTEAESGICISRGRVALESNSGGVELLNNQLQLMEPDMQARPIGGVFDFVLSGLPQHGASYYFVVPQRAAIPEGAVYRKYSAADGWKNFVQNSANQLFSAPGEQGYCPAPGDASWLPGLTIGHWCVQLLIEDGGPNDADGTVNGRIVDPGGVSVLLNGNTFPVAGDDTYSVMWNQMHVLDVLENDSDTDGDPLTITSASALFGHVAISDDGLLLEYTPQTDYLGTDTVTYSISDGRGGSATAQALVTVFENQAPVVSGVYTAETNNKTTIVLSVLSVVTDADGDTLTVATASAQHGSVSIVSGQQIRYTPLAGYTGTDVVSFTVSDGRGGQVTGVANVNVTAIEVIQVDNKSSGGALGIIGVLLAMLALLRRVKGRMLLAGILSVLSLGATSADNPWVIEMQVGKSKARLSQADVARTLPAETQLLAYDNRDTSWSLGANFALADGLWLQGYYVDLGDATVSLSRETQQPDVFHRDVSQLGALLAEGIRTSIGWRVAETADGTLSLQVQGGVFSWWAEQNSQRTGGEVLKHKTSDTDIYWGLQAVYRVDDNVGISAGFERYRLDSNSVDNISVGLRWYF